MNKLIQQTSFPILLLVLFLLFQSSPLQATSPSFPNDSKTLKVGCFLLKPHCIDENQGTAISYFKLIAEQMGYQVSFRNYPLTRILERLKNRKIDLILFLAKNEEREKVYAYPEQPLFYTKAALAVSSSNPLKELKSPQELFSMNISGVAAGFKPVFMKHPQIKVNRIFGKNTLQRGIALVILDRIDAYYIPDIFSLDYYVHSQGFQNKIRILPIPGKKVPLYSVFSKSSAAKYIKAYQKALEKVQSKATYEEYYHQTIQQPK